MEVRVSRRRSVLKLFQFLKSESLSLCKVGADRVCQVLRVSVAIDTYAMEDGQTLELFIHLWHKSNSPLTLLHNAHFLQLVPANNLTMVQIRYEIGLSTAFKA